MREIPQFSRLYADEQLRSPSGRFVLHYDTAGIAVIADTERDVVTWRAGAAGRLLLGDGGEVQVEAGDSHETIWCSGFAAPGAHVLILTDAGDLELLSGEHVRLRNSRTGPVEALALRDSAPAADITMRQFPAQRTQEAPDRRTRTGRMAPGG